MKYSKQTWIDEIQLEINAYQIKIDKAEHDISRWNEQIQRRKRLIQHIMKCGLPKKRAEL
jgi:multidrug resistance efflux pump